MENFQAIIRWVTLPADRDIRQWGMIAAVHVPIILNYLDWTPFMYNIYPFGAFGMILRCIYSDLIAYSERKNRNHPLIWWIVAFLFPSVTLAYLYFVPSDEERPRETQLKFDIGFAAVCVVYLVISVLYRLFVR